MRIKVNTSASKQVRWSLHLVPVFRPLSDTNKITIGCFEKRSNNRWFIRSPSLPSPLYNRDPPSRQPLQLCICWPQLPLRAPLIFFLRELGIRFFSTFIFRYFTVHSSRGIFLFWSLCSPGSWIHAPIKLDWFVMHRFCLFVFRIPHTIIQQFILMISLNVFK